LTAVATATPPSLTSRLFRGLIGPMAVLALLLGLGGGLAIHSMVEAVNDRLLGASARSIAETLEIEDDNITLDLPPWALGMLENSSRDNIYYNVYDGDRLITGYPNLPPPPSARLADQQTTFRYGSFRGQPVRIAAEARRLPRIQNLVVVQIAETLEARRTLFQHMVIQLVFLEVALLALATVLIPIGVRWGITPLTRLRHEMDERSATDLTPLPLANVPRELRDLLTAFNSLLARLDNAVDGMRRFTADASHQMRTPLSILRTHISVLKMSGMRDGANAQESLADIEAATDRLQHLLIQLLALARAEGVKPSGLELHDIDITTTARAIAEEHALVAVRAAMEMHFVVDDSAPLLVHGDEVLAAEVIRNLIDNAIRYNRTGGSITVHLFGDAENVVLDVEDDGPGIPEAERNKVFTRFYRLARDQSRPGSGLGLSIVQLLAQALNAQVTLSTGSTGTGLRVRLTFRRSRQTVDRMGG
jgi:two-component system sensor histidine kinase TctE